MDRSRIGSAIPHVVFTLDADADVVIIDLARGVEQVTSIRASHPEARARQMSLKTPLISSGRRGRPNKKVSISGSHARNLGHARVHDVHALSP